MKILHLSNSDKKGGAAIAAYRLHRGLRDQGVDSQMLVQHKVSDDDTVHGSTGLTGKALNGARGILDSLPVYRYQNRESGPFSPAWLPENVPQKIAKFDPDVLHLHWVNNGFLSTESLSDIDVPIVWTLHDMWPFTGGCHYSGNCSKYQNTCGTCPQLKSGSGDDLSYNLWSRKRDVYSENDITVVVPSHWLAEKTAKSSLLGDSRIEVVHNGIDTEKFRPQSRSEGLDLFNLNPDNRYILFGASYKTKRKGGDLFIEAIEQIDSKKISVLTFGNSGLDPDTWPLQVHHLGYLSENELQTLYSAADLTAIPSREDNLPNIGIESLSSGTPVIGFDIGGMNDIISHGDTGFLAPSFDVNEYATNIKFALSSSQRLNRLSQNSRAYCLDNFNLSDISKSYIEIYDDI